MHTQNLQADPRASLLVTELEAGGDPLGASQATLLGTAGLVPDAEVSEARKLYLDRYPKSREWEDFGDFSFWRIELVNVYYLGGFGVMGWLAAKEYENARPDPLASSAARIIEHVNADHVDALILLAREFGGVEAQEAAMIGVDRLGFQLRLKTQDGVLGGRIAFLREVKTPEETERVMIEMVRQARQH